jgi:hypothetical protein
MYLPLLSDKTIAYGYIKTILKEIIEIIKKIPRNKSLKHLFTQAKNGMQGKVIKIR